MILVRPMELRDLKAAMEIEEDSFEDGAWTLEEYADMLADGGEALVGVLRNEVVGTLWFKRAGNLMDCFSLGVNPHYRQMGVARALATNVLALARADFRIHRVSLEVRPSNAYALAFYQRLGFVESERIKDWYPNGEEAIRMVLTISR